MPTPTVVFISQLGTGGDSWQPVIDHLASGAAVFTYDRPGTGSAPPRSAPNPPLPYAAMAAELGQLLQIRKVEGPLVVVGHSVGSLIARMFVEHNSERISGIVHVDGSIPRLSLWPAADYPQNPDGDGPGATHFDTLAGEVEIVQARNPAVPAAIVTRTPGRWAPGYPADRADPLWTAYQRQLAQQYQTPLIVAANAGHQIPADAPSLVAYLVDEVVRAGQSGGRPRFSDLEAAGGRFDKGER